ncbi:MAG: 2-hydroxyacyl-CoA dehydratase [Thermoplasmatota archaeon]
MELALREDGIPMVKLESEYDEGDVEQVRTRIEAFVEMIKARREYHMVHPSGGAK